MVDIRTGSTILNRGLRSAYNMALVVVCVVWYVVMTKGLRGRVVVIDISIS